MEESRLIVVWRVSCLGSHLGCSPDTGKRIVPLEGISIVAQHRLIVEAMLA